LNKVKKPQWITIGIGAVLTISVFLFARRIPDKKPVTAEMHSENDGHDHEAADMATISIDSVLNVVKKQLNPQQVASLSDLEKPLTSGNPAIAGKTLAELQLKAYHQLEHFWRDSIHFFPGYAWYTAEAARLENSEKSLTFAAHLILNNLQEGHDSDPAIVRWLGLQAKDLFERSLHINPDNDSSRVGLGACYLFGNISPAPMTGIRQIQEVAAKDSTNVFAQMMLIKGSLVSGQFDNAINRLHTVCRVQPDNLEALLLLADLYDRKGEKAKAMEWYRKSLPYVKRADMKAMIESRIEALGK
jgi:tetratricopeptide (TPR) repeat protein